MPNGFIGRPALTYLTQVSEAHTRAENRMQRAPQEGRFRMRARPLQFNPEDATVGRFTTGRGDSSNIVVSQQEYDTVSYYINQIDDTIGECIYRTACEIEEMCQTIFILPSVVRGCMNISDTVKGSLNQFRTMTDETIQQARRFARDIMDIGH